MRELKELFRNTISGSWKTLGIDTQYRIEEEEKEVYLFFQQTSSTQDWKDNFMCLPYKNQEIRWFAHQGFTRVWKSIRDTLVPLVLKKSENKKLIIAGFSHGAAIATLAHEDFRYNGKNPQTYTFGGPRVLWLPDYSIKLRFENLTRIVAIGDIVSMLPPWIMGYGHVGKCSKIGLFGFPSHTRHYPTYYIAHLPE